MAEDSIELTQQVTNEEERDENPYFAIEESIYGDAAVERRKKRKKSWIKVGIISALALACMSLVIYDTVYNIRREESLSDVTLVNGMTYKELISYINKSNTGDSKTWVDFDNPHKIGNGKNQSVKLESQTLKIESSNTTHSYLLVNPSSQAIYQSYLAFDGMEYDFSTHNLSKGDYILCSYMDRYTIPYEPVVDSYFYNQLGASNYRRASINDGSIQQERNISVIQDPTLLSLVVIRIS